MKGWQHIEHMTPLEKRLASVWLGVSPQDIPTPPSGLIVGEMPGRNTRAVLPMFPHPKNSSGGRLHLLSDLPIAIYLGKLQRRNLIHDFHEEWPRFEARKIADELKQNLPESTRVILCGRAVGDAFGHTKFFTVDSHNGSWSVCIPHPSGLSREYTDPIKRIGARYALRWAADTP